MINLPDPDYHQYVIKPYLATRFSTVDRLYLPMIDRSYSAHNAVPPVIWGMLWENWQPNAAEGNTVFLRAYEDRGAENYQKKIYYSGVTPDLYRDKLGHKVDRFIERLLDPDNAGRPLMDLYLNSYFDLYWDLHLGKSDKDIPDYAIRIGQLFNRCMARIAPLDKTFYENYMEVRRLRGRLDAWILRCIDEIKEKIDCCEEEGVDENKKFEKEGVDETIAYYWLKNAICNPAPEGFELDVKDISFECFHNFVALSQWGNTIYNTMDRLRPDGGHAAVRDYFDDMAANNSWNETNGGHFTRLDRFVMELFRTILPNDASVSTVAKRTRVGGDVVYTRHDHRKISHDELHWDDPHAFDPERYLGKPTSDQVDEKYCKGLGFARCPFGHDGIETADERGTVTNSGFGTVYNVSKGNGTKDNGTEEKRPEPVLEHAGYAPFGFGYRRCPGELFTVEVIKKFLRTAADRKIRFVKLDGKPKEVPVAPGTVVEDDIGFVEA